MKSPKYLKTCPTCGKNHTWRFTSTAWMPESFSSVKKFEAAGARFPRNDKGEAGLDTFICTNCQNSALDVPKN